MWDRENQFMVKDFGEVHSKGIQSMAITYDSEYLITADGAGNLKVWNTSDCSLNHDFGQVHDGKISA